MIIIRAWDCFNPALENENTSVGGYNCIRDVVSTLKIVFRFRLRLLLACARSKASRTHKIFVVFLQ